MLENKDHLTENKISSNRSFGFVFVIFFIVWFLIYLINFKTVDFYLLFISLLLIIITLSYPRALRIPNKIWHILSISLGKIMTPLVITIIYIIGIAPLGILLKLINKDLIKQKKDNKIKSYWVMKKNNIGSMKDQF